MKNGDTHVVFWSIQITIYTFPGLRSCPVCVPSNPVQFGFCGMNKIMLNEYRSINALLKYLYLGPNTQNIYWIGPISSKNERVSIRQMKEKCGNQLQSDNIWHMKSKVQMFKLSSIHTERVLNFFIMKTKLSKYLTFFFCFLGLFRNLNQQAQLTQGNWDIVKADV